MAKVYLILGFLVFSNIDQILGGPEFPKFPDDYTIAGTMRTTMGNMIFNMWFSKSLKSSRVDSAMFGEQDHLYMLENEGTYGTRIFVKSVPGKTTCKVQEGTANHPIKYISYFTSLPQNLTYVGVENVDGEEMQKWSTTGKRYVTYFLIRQDANGPAPFRIDHEGVSIQFESFSAISPPASVFKYDTKDCRHRKGLTLKSLLKF